MKHLAYALPRDVLAPTWSLVTGTELGAQYPVSKLGTIYPHDVFSANEVTVRPVADLGAKIEVQGVLVFNTNLDAALTLTLQATDDNVWPGSSLSQTLTIPAKHYDGFSAGVWFDLATRVPVLASRSWRYWSLLVTANSVPVTIGMAVLVSTVRRLGRNITWSPVSSLGHGEIRNPTKFGVHSVLELGNRDRVFKAGVPQADDATRAQLIALREDARGGNRPFFLCAAGDEDASDPLKEPMWVEWGGDTLDVTHDFLNLHGASVLFHELSYGQPL